MQLRRMAVAVTILMVAVAGCSKSPAPATTGNPANKSVCNGLSSVYTSLDGPINNVLLGKGTADDKAAIEDGAEQLRDAADIATGPLKSALNNAAKAADGLTDGTVTLADASAIHTSFTTLGKEVDRQCGKAG